MRLLEQRPDLAGSSLGTGATRQEAKAYFLLPIRHHVYAGDTALHVAAAAHHRDLAEALVARGAAVRARNRRGAEPLHYAADGGPSEERDSEEQRRVISYLIEAGADPNAMDKSGVAPLHRAVRNRASAAVEVLISSGADPRRRNRSGSTPLHLAVQTPARATRVRRRPKMSSAGSSSCSLTTGPIPQTPMHTERRSWPPPRASGSVRYSATTEGHGQMASGSSAS